MTALRKEPPEPSMEEISPHPPHHRRRSVAGAPRLEEARLGPGAPSDKSRRRRGAAQSVEAAVIADCSPSRRRRRRREPDPTPQAGRPRRRASQRDDMAHLREEMPAGDASGEPGRRRAETRDAAHRRPAADGEPGPPASPSQARGRGREARAGQFGPRGVRAEMRTKGRNRHRPKSDGEEHSPAKRRRRAVARAVHRLQPSLGAPRAAFGEAAPATGAGASHDALPRYSCAAPRSGRHASAAPRHGGWPARPEAGARAGATLSARTDLAVARAFNSLSRPY